MGIKWHSYIYTAGQRHFMPMGKAALRWWRGPTTTEPLQQKSQVWRRSALFVCQIPVQMKSEPTCGEWIHCRAALPVAQKELSYKGLQHLDKIGCQGELPWMFWIFLPLSSIDSKLSFKKNTYLLLAFPKNQGSFCSQNYLPLQHPRHKFEEVTSLFIKQPLVHRERTQRLYLKEPFNIYQPLRDTNTSMKLGCSACMLGSVLLPLSREWTHATSLLAQGIAGPAQHAC